MKTQSDLVKASVMGGVIGSAVTAALFLMRDKDTRKKLLSSLDTVMDTISDGVDAAKPLQNAITKLAELKDDTEDTADKVKRKVKDVVDDKTSKDKDK